MTTEHTPQRLPRISRALPFLALLFYTLGAFAQDVRITEFLTSNQTGIVDQDGDASPWIEIWNASPTTKVSMAGWKLTDGATQWTFPAVDLLPEGYMIVWASGKNRTAVTESLHTNFTLPKEGGNLSLIRAANTVASAFTAYPPQQVDVSYGRDGANPTLTGFYSKPTPGETNNYAGSGVSGKVVFSEPSKTFTGTLSITLTQAKPVEGAVIRYTTNGTVPLSTSLQYTGPISVSTSQIIRARVFSPGLLPGETESRAFMLLDANSSNFSSSIPVVLISNFGLGTPPATGDQNGYMWVFEPGADGRTRLTSPPTLVSRIAMDRRGSTTLDNPKFNLNVETRKARDNDDQDVSLLGMPDGSDWVFSAPYEYDRSLLHNPFVYALSNAIGRQAMRTRMAEVFIDVDAGAVTYTGGASGNYFGVYNIMEKIRRGKDRVDIQNLHDYDNTQPTVTGGYIVKVDRKDAGDSGFTTPHEGSAAGTLGFAYYEPKEPELVSPQRDPQEQYIKSFLTAFDNACYSANYTDPVRGYAAYLDVDAAIDHHLLNVLPMNVDGLRLSGFMHKDRGGKLAYGPVWDFDRSLDSTDSRDNAPQQWRGTPLADGDAGTDFFNYTWWKRLFSDPDFYQKYVDRFTELRKGAFSTANIHALIDSLNASITDEAANRDVARWGKTKRAYTSSITGQSYAGQTAEAQRLKDWLQQRLEFMESQWVGPVTIAPGEGNVRSGTTVTMTAPAGTTIYYTTDGSDPRPSGGDLPTSANVQIYTAPIPVTASMRIRARAYKPDHTALSGANNPPLVNKWSARTDARFSTDTPANAGNLIITEINYHPTNPTPTELAVDPLFTEADFEFIEIKNVGTTPIDLGGSQFIVGISFAFTGENAISLLPGEFAILAANPQAFTARYGTKPNVVGPFKGDLSNGGERLSLVGATGEAILDFTYDDAWYPLSDGDGRSLVVWDQTAAGTDYNSPESWRASVTAGGSPGNGELPVVTTLAATEITATSALLKAQVTPNGTLTTPTMVLDDSRHEAANVPGESTVVIVEKTVTNLSPHTHYRFRAEANNEWGTATGEELTFTTLNRQPKANDKHLHFPTHEPFVIDVLVSDSDPDGDLLTISAVTQGQYGTVAISDDATSIIYTPGTGYTGNDSFTYTISDGFGGTDTATVVLQNTVPVAAPDTVVSNGDPVTFNLTLNDSDADSSDTLVVSSVSQGSVGTVAITGTGAITYTPGPQFFGRDTFSYTITDGSASATANVAVRNTAPIMLTGPTKGTQVPGETEGVVYGSIDLPASGIFSGLVQSGRVKQRAIFAGDGSILLKTGAPAPGIEGATIASLGKPSGQAVVATIKGAKGSGTTTANDTVLYAVSADGSVRIAAREGVTTLGGALLKNFLSIDGNGDSIFFLAKLAGAGVKAANDLALCVAPADGEARILVREGDIIDGKPVTAICTLVSSPGTAAEGRWRVDSDTIGVRLSFPGKEQVLYSIPASAMTTEDWTRWSRSGDVYADAGMTQSFGLAGFGTESVAFTAQLMRGAESGPNTVTASNDTAIVRSTLEGSVVLASEGGAVPDADGTTLPGLQFQKFADPVTGANGRTAFTATLKGKGINTANRSGLWLAGSNGTMKLLARTGELAPDGSRWAAFESVAFPDGAQSGPLFTAKLVADAATPKNSRALWSVNSKGSLQRLLRTGQALPFGGSTLIVKSFVALTSTPGSAGAASGFDDDQHVTALVSFTDGTQALIDIAIP